MNDIDRLRRFSRFYTAKVGLLGRTYAGAGLTLGEARLLHDLSDRGTWAPRKSAEALGLDEGYVSRIISKLEGAGYLRRGSDPKDGRIRTIEITEVGQAKAAEMQDIARADLSARLQGTSPEAISAAADALDVARSCLGKVSPDDVRLRDLEVGDIGWLIQQHGLHYHRTCGFDASFETFVAEILRCYIRDRDPETERAFIAELKGRAVGSVFCTRAERTGVAKLRLFYVLPETRGLGLGKTLMEACLQFAKQAGYSRMELWTHESHHAACALYTKYGFQITSRNPIHMFGSDQIELTYEIDLVEAD